MRILRWTSYLLAALFALAAVGYGAFAFSPWPSVLLIRQNFEDDAVERNRALEKHLPDNVVELRDQRYGTSRDTVVDIFIPSDAEQKGKRLPTIVWIHGGAFIAGNKSDVAGYLRILAGRGFTVVGAGYSLAPGARYPTPVLQVNELLGFLARNADRFSVDPTRFFLAGDSAGAQIAAQLAVAVSNPSYAAALGVSPAVEREQLRGLILFCGIYDAEQIKHKGKFIGVIETALWAYLGERDFADDPRLAEFSIGRHLTPQFPPAFISVGNDDQLAPQSVMLADALRAQHVEVDALFFPADRKPPLQHEYQFDLDEAASREALERMVSFVARLSK